LIFFKKTKLLRGRGMEVNVFFFPSLEMWKEEGGKRYIGFFWKCFFHCGEAREGFLGITFLRGFFLWGEGSVESRHSWV
jgi:hypothetical protein